MKITIRMNDRHRVEAIERDAGKPSWVEKMPLPNVPKWLFPILNIRDEQGYRTLTNSNESIVLSKQLEVTPFSGQWWQSIRIDQKAEVLELVEWLGKDSNDYVTDSEKMFPADRPKNYRRLADNHSFNTFRR